PQTNIAPGPEQVMSDASPNKPVESLEEKQKVEEKVASKPVEEPPPEVKPAPNPEVGRAASRGAAGNPAPRAAPAAAHALGAAGNSRADRRASGRAHAGSDDSPKFKRASDLEITDRGGDRAQQALSRDFGAPRRTGGRPGLLQSRPARSRDR